MSNTADAATKTQTCQYCGMIHGPTCPRIKAISYWPDGWIERVEFFAPVDYPPLVTGDPSLNVYTSRKTV